MAEAEVQPAVPSYREPDSSLSILLMATAPVLGSHAIRRLPLGNLSLGKACGPCLALSPTHAQPGRVKFTTSVPHVDAGGQLPSASTMVTLGKSRG